MLVIILISVLLGVAIGLIFRLFCTRGFIPIYRPIYIPPPYYEDDFPKKLKELKEANQNDFEEKGYRELPEEMKLKLVEYLKEIYPIGSEKFVEEGKERIENNESME